MIVTQNGSRLSPIHHQRGLYFYHMNYYDILKEHLEVLHKLYAKDFQITLDKLSVLKFPLVKLGHLYLSYSSCVQIVKCYKLKRKKI